MRFSIGRSKYGQVSDILDITFSEFCELCSDMAQIPRSPSDKDEHWWGMPAILNEGATHRTLDDVDHMAAWGALDIDHGNVGLSDIRLKMAGTQMMAFTTASSRADDQRWRLIIALSRATSMAEHHRVWKFFSSRFPGGTDLTVWNANRIHYLPAMWDGGDNIFHTSNIGRPADVDSILALIPETPDPTIPASDAMLKPAPDGSVMISAHLISVAQGEPIGGRMWRLLVSAAARYRFNGWEIEAGDLYDAAVVANAQFSHGKRRPNLLRECQRAITWVERNVQPKSPLEKLRNRILFQQRGFGRKSLV